MTAHFSTPQTIFQSPLPLPVLQETWCLPSVISVVPPYLRSIIIYQAPKTDLTVWQNCNSNRLRQTNSIGVYMLAVQCQNDLGPRCRTCGEGVRLSNPVLHFPTFWQVCSFQFPNANWQRPLDSGFGWGQRPAAQHRGQEQELKK